MLETLPRRPAKAIRETLLSHTRAVTVYDAYNAATHYATHQMRSARGAFKLLHQINKTFQAQFPISRN